MGGRRDKPTAKQSLAAADVELAMRERQLETSNTPTMLAALALTLHKKLWEVATYLAPPALGDGGDAETIAIAASVIDRARIAAILASERAAIALAASGDSRGAFYHLMQALAHGASGADRARVLDLLAQLTARSVERDSPVHEPAARVAGRRRSDAIR